MTAAHLPIQRPRQAKLLVIDEQGQFRHWLRSRLVDLFRSGDLVIRHVRFLLLAEWGVYRTARSPFLPEPVLHLLYESTLPNKRVKLPAEPPSLL